MIHWNCPNIYTKEMLQSQLLFIVHRILQIETISGVAHNLHETAHRCDYRECSLPMQCTFNRQFLLQKIQSGAKRT